MASAPPLLIADVERETGIPRATLRIWEHRYGFPQPVRLPGGVRAYPREQVEKLRTIAQLVQSGHKPGQVVGAAPAQLAHLLRMQRRNFAAADEPVLQALQRHDADALLAMLRHLEATLGLERFIAQIGRLNEVVGLAWQGGHLQVYQEHAYVEAVQNVVRRAMLALPIPSADARPRVLLATVEDELHGLGLLMAQATFVLAGCRCVPLGVSVPLQQIVAAARAFGSDIVALSFSAYQRTRKVTAQLGQLRAGLPAHVDLWAGGSSPALRRLRLDGVIVVTELEGVPGAVGSWRERRHTPVRETA